METASGQLRVADIIAQRLFVEGCRFAFGIPGGETLALVDALECAGIEFVVTRHENAAGFMAEAAHHSEARRGRMVPGVLVPTVGPGLANCVNVVANAMQDRVPMIVLSGCVGESDAMTYTHQVFDQRALMRPVTKASLSISADSAPVTIDKAIRIAMSGRPGPVHIDVPVDVASALVDVSRLPSHASVSRPSSAPMVVDLRSDEARHVMDALAMAERPLVLAGLDLLKPGGARALQRFAEHYAIPVLTTYKAKGVLREDHPLSLGGFGLSPKADALMAPVLKRADLVILAGYDPIEMRKGWRAPFADAVVVDIAAVENTHYVHGSAHCFVGDVAATLDTIVEASVADSASDHPKQTRWPGGELQALRRSLQEAFSPELVEDGPFGPAQVVAELAAVFGDASVAVDTGAHRILLSQMWRSMGPRRLMQSSGLCTMGAALPLAIGTALTSDDDGPARTVVAVTGDAGLEMVLGDLSTLRDQALKHKLRVLVLVFDDQSLALIEMKQRKLGLARNGVMFSGTDFAAVANALGGEGVCVDTREGLRSALRTAESRLATGSFQLISCSIPSESYDTLI